MAFGSQHAAPSARARREVPRTQGRRFVRSRVLGTEAIYELLDDQGELVTAEVLKAPGLAPGTRLHLLRSAIRAMEAVDPSEPLLAARLSSRGPRAAA
jgi:hypothetical protein